MLTPNQINRSQISNVSSDQLTNRRDLEGTDIKFTNTEAREFWDRYIASKGQVQVALETFCDAIQAEFSLSVIKPCLEKLPKE